jgi:hypothetical protein
MAAPPRLAPPPTRFDFARMRLADRIAGPELDSGNGVNIAVPAMTDDE